MGLFGLGGKAPQYPTVTAPTVGTGQNYYNQALQFGNQNFGNAMGARESAISDMNNPNYYASFQPTSFEQALGDQNFKNVWPNQQNYMANTLSKSGMAYSPTAAATLGKAYGDTSFNIGSYLANQGNQRAMSSLQQRMGVDPMSMLNPYANLGAQQGNSQAGFDWNATKQNADAQYANSMQKYMQDQQMMAMIGQLGGAAVGGMIGGPQGAMMGSGMGGAMMGGGQNMGQYMQASQGLNNSWGGDWMKQAPQSQSQMVGFPTTQYSGGMGSVRPVY